MRTGGKSGILFLIMEQENKTTKPRSRLKVLFVIALILAAAIFGIVKLVAWQQRVKNERELIETIRAIKQSLSKQRIYYLNADPVLSRVTVTLYNKQKVSTDKTTGHIFIDLSSRKCRVPLLKILGKRYSYKGWSGAPSGHSIISVQKSKMANSLKQKLKDFCNKYLKKDFLLNDSRLYFYDADTDKIRPLPVPEKAIHLYLLGHLPGKNQVIVAKTGPDGYGLYVFDKNGQKVKSYKGNYYASPVGVYEQSKNRYSGCWLTHGVTLTPWDKGSVIRIKAPEKQFFIGYSPELKYALFAPVKQSFLDGYSVMAYPSRNYLATHLSFYRKKALHDTSPVAPNSGEQKTKAANKSIQVTLWNRLADKRVMVFSIPILKDYAHTIILTTKAGIMVTHEVPGKNGKTNYLKRHFNFKTGKWTNLTSVIPKSTNRLVVFFISADGLKMVGDIPTKPDNSGTPKTRFALIDFQSVTRYNLPLEAVRGTTIMKDGRILGVLGDALVYYDPATQKTEIIIKDLYETWKRLVDEKLRSR